MPTDFFGRSDALEECYEFMLAYAGQGLPSEQGSQAGSQIRGFLEGAATALEGLAESCALAVAQHGLEPAETYQAFGRVLQRDAQDSLAAIRIVLLQPAISSQLIDNLNASMHLRALLTDLFLLGEILRSRSQTAVTSEPE
jgi:hypothetical protein